MQIHIQIANNMYFFTLIKNNRKCVMSKTKIITLPSSSLSTILSSTQSVSLWWPKMTKIISSTIVFNIISMQYETILNLNHRFTKSPNIHSSKVAQVPATRSHLCHNIHNMNPVNTKHLSNLLLIQEFIPKMTKPSISTSILWYLFSIFMIKCITDFGVMSFYKLHSWCRF